MHPHQWRQRMIEFVINFVDYKLQKLINLFHSLNIYESTNVYEIQKNLKRETVNSIFFFVLINFYYN